MHIQINALVPELEAATRIAAAGFVQPLSETLRADVAQHLMEGCLVQSFTNEEEVVLGFAIYRLFEFVPDTRLLYLAGIILDPAIQGQHLAERSICQAAKELRATHLGLRTQSLRMWVVGDRLTKSAWEPNLVDWAEQFHVQTHFPKPELMSLGQKLAEVLGCSSFPYLPGFYGAPLYGTKPTYKHRTLQTWWDTWCEFERGDAVLCVGSLRDL